MAGKNGTKQEIIEISLDLFSTRGFEATSVSQIAEAVGIRKASLYSHFKSKQEILDEIVKTIDEQYERHSLFARADWNNTGFTDGKENLSPDDVAKMIIGQFRFIIHDSHISHARKMLTIEQFGNRQLAEMQTKRNYPDVMRFFEGFTGFLIKNGKLNNGDEEAMAAQLCLPVSVWINLCDREPEREDEIVKLIEKHVKQFFETYKV